MKITAVRTTPLRYECEKPYMSASGTQAARSALLVEVETDTGLTGIGEAGTSGGPVVSTQTIIEQELTPLLVGEDPLLIERLWQKMFVRTRQHGRRGILLHAISGIDIALWDLAGKIAGLPVYRLLGGYCDRVEAYASGGFYQQGKGIPELVREAEGYAAQGYRGMKMKIGRNVSTQSAMRELIPGNEQCVVSFDEDLARVAAVREALGPEAKLMVDVNCAWGTGVALQMGRALEPYRLYWLEEPVATDNLEGSAALAHDLATPIAGYETEQGVYGYRELIARGAIDIAQPDITWAGGFSECRRIAMLAHAHHIAVAPHAFSSAITLMASAHLLASLPNGLELEFDQNPNALRSDLLKEPVSIDQEGCVHLPQRPGLGIEIDHAVVDRYRIP